MLVKMMKFCFRENIPIVYIDETGFSMRPIHRQEYTAPGRKITLERSNTNQKNVTVSAAISANDGLIHFEMVEGGQTIPTYITFLINLRAKIGIGKRIGLFYDGLNAHKNAEVINMILEWGWVPILNEAYRCEQNPIESFFSRVKTYYYARRNNIQANPIFDQRNFLLNGIQNKKMACEAFLKFQTYDCRATIERSVRAMEERYGEVLRPEAGQERPNDITQTEENPQELVESRIMTRKEKRARDK